MKNFANYVEEVFLSRRKKNPNYSLRAFASSLNISPATISNLLNGKQELSEKMRQRLGFALGLSPQQLNRFMAKPHGNKKGVKIHYELGHMDYSQITIDKFNIISDWYHYGFLQLMRVTGFKNDLKWIAKRLGLPRAEIQAAIKRLKRIGILKEGENGQLIDNTNGRTSDIEEGVSHEAQRRFQKQTLEKAQQAIDKIDVAKRSFTSMTMAINVEDIPRAKEEIKKFRRHMAQMFGENEMMDEVYQINIALYPLTVLEEKKTKYN